ncbi:DUF2357 domain-containing protein, partial [Cronobacter sakazakii]
MKIKVSILGGKRQGDAFELKLIDEKINSSLFILEDEAIEIAFTSENYYEKISLLLYENEVEPTLIERVGELWTYRWLPKRLGRFSYECFFHNYYGIAELVLEAQYGERTELFSFQSI